MPIIPPSPPRPDEFHKIMVFIDGSNILHSTQRFQKGLKIDYKKLVDYLKMKRQLVRTYFFSSYDPESKDKPQKFYDALLSAGGFEIISKPLRSRIRENKTYKIEKGVDVALVTHMLSHAFKHNFDVAILISGDADYVDAIKVIKDLGKNVEVVAFKNSIAPELRRIADRFIAIEDILPLITK